MRFWAALRWPDRLLVGGAAGMVMGAAAVLLAGGRNRNDVPGASGILIVLGVAAGVAWLVARRSGLRAELASATVLGAAMAGIVLTGLELLESVRLGFATDRLGLLGLVGRMLAFAAAATLLGGVLRAGPMRVRVRGLSRLLAILGTLAAVCGWTALIGVADGFAMRTVDAAGMAAAIGIAVLSLMAPDSRLRQLLDICLAAVVLVVLADAVVILAPSVGSLLGAGPATSVPVIAYVGGATAVVASSALRLRTMTRGTGGSSNG